MKDRGNNLSGKEAQLTCGKCLTGKWRCRGELELPKRRSFKAPTKAMLTECGGRGQAREEPQEENSRLSLSLQSKEN